jgi:uncharacterized protein (UPF0276 family)
MEGWLSSYVGSGIGYRRPHRAALLDPSLAHAPGVLEVIPDHFFAEPSEIEPLAAWPLVFHDVGLSIGTAPGAADEVVRRRIERIRELVRRARPFLFSDHLAITRSPSGVDLGHLCPVLPDRRTLDLVCDRVRALADALEVPVALENIAHPFELEGDLTEAEFFCELVRRTGCGMLLDLTNLVLDARNFGFDAAERLDAYPLEAVWQVHLAGGVRVGRFWVDSHGAPVGRMELGLLARMRRRATALRAIVVERDQNLPPLAELLREAREAERAWHTEQPMETACPPI